MLTYTIVPVIIAVGVSLLVMYTIGYRYNSTDHRLEQGGLVQFVTQPSGARVEVDGVKLPGRTNTRLDATAGSHTVLMTKAGYHTWQKTVTVEPGKLLWLNYARLIPKEITALPVLPLPALGTSLASYQNDQYVLLENPAVAELSVVDLSSRGAVERKVSIDPALLANDASSHAFSLVSLDRTGRYAIVEVSGTSKQWLVIDLTNPERSQNISTITGDEITKIMFLPSDARKVYMLTKNTLRQVNLDEQTISAPLVSGVADVTMSHRGVMGYVSVRDEATSKRTIGYYTAGASAPSLLRQVFDSGSQPIEFRISDYNDARYGALRLGDSLELFSFSTQGSDASLEAITKSVSTIALPEGSDSMSISPTGRFILSQKASTFTTYDLELMKVTSSTLKGDTAVDRQLLWLDEHHVWSDRGGKLYMYEFDGENAHLIDSIKPGQAVLLSKNGKQLWYIDAAEDKYAIKSVQLAQ